MKLRQPKYWILKENSRKLDLKKYFFPTNK